MVAAPHRLPHRGLGSLALTLRENPIGDTGAASIIDAVGSRNCAAVAWLECIGGREHRKRFRTPRGREGGRQDEYDGAGNFHAMAGHERTLGCVSLLDLSQCGIGQEGFVHLSKNLSTEGISSSGGGGGGGLPALTHLMIGRNHPGPVGI